MNQQDALREIITYWISKAEESLLSAQGELSAGRLSFSVNRIYYSCFYAVSAVLLQENLKFKKHSGVRASFHKYFVKFNKVSHDLGKFYDELFEARQRGDYLDLVYFEKDQVEEWLTRAREFVQVIKKLVQV